MASRTVVLAASFLFLACKVPEAQLGQPSPDESTPESNPPDNSNQSCAKPLDKGDCALSELPKSLPSSIAIWVEVPGAPGGGWQLVLPRDVQVFQGNHTFRYSGAQSGIGTSQRCFGGAVSIVLDDQGLVTLTFDGFLASGEDENKYMYDAGLLRENSSCPDCKKHETRRRYVVTRTPKLGASNYSFVADGLPETCEVGVDLLGMEF